MTSQAGTKRFASLLLLLALLSSTGLAQQRGQGAQKRPSSQKARTDERASARRTKAINLLVETANGARLFKDLLYRARIQMLAADALWAFDEAQARSLFRRAWEAATAADREEARAAQEEAGQFFNSGETAWTASRDEVLSKAAARDPKLAEGFMRELVAERERAESSTDNQPTRRTPWREPSPMGARRLALAYELLNRKEYLRAASIVEPLINEGVSGDLMEFLVRLRAQSSVGMERSDSLYLRLLERAKVNPNTDANDVLLLSAYIISPQLMMVVDEKGGLQFRSLPPATLKHNPVEGIAAGRFYSVAVAVLLQRASNQVQSRVSRYVATSRLTPFFEQAGPEYAQFVPAMRSQLNALSSEMESARRDALDSQFKLTSLASKNQADPLAPQLGELTRASDKTERDRISLGIVRKAARELLWDRALRAAYAIEDGDMRRAALSFVAVSQIADITRAYRDDKEDDFEAVARFVRRAAGDAPAFASAWGLAQASVIAARKGNRDEINALLTEGESYAARAEKGSRQQIAAYAVLLDAASRVEKSRAWDFLTELVRAVNSADGYMGDETALPTSAESIEGSELSEALSIESDAFRLDRVFATMARIDFDKTESEAQALTGEIPRAYARIACARAELEKAVAGDKP
jgi:histone H3/H4